MRSIITASGPTVFHSPLKASHLASGLDDRREIRALRCRAQDLDRSLIVETSVGPEQPRLGCRRVVGVDKHPNDFGASATACCSLSHINLQLMATFTNSSAFGEFISEIRALTSGPRKRVEEMGGPSERQQADIESGKDMPITDRTQDQYATFLQEQSEQPVARSSQRTLHRQFFEAACAVFQGAQLSPEPAWDELSPLYPGSGFILGDLTNPGTPKPLNVGKLAFPTHSEPIFARSFADRAGGIRAFTQAASRIATRHEAITLMPWPVAVANNFVNGAPWPSHHTYRVGLNANDGFPRVSLDPLRGVDDLEKAYVRAAALGAPAGADRTYLAWAILLANSAAAQANTSPLTAWMNLSAPNQGPAKTGALAERDRWANLLDQIHTDTGLATTIKLSDVILRAQPFLLRWAEEWLAARGLGFNSFTGTSSTEVTWVMDTASHRHTEWDSEDNANVPGPQLWFCDDALAPAVSAILNDRRTGNFVLKDTALIASGSQHPEFIWCPIGASERHVLVQKAGTDQWWPVVLF